MLIFSKFFFIFVISFLVTLVSILLLRIFAIKLDIVDKPSTRKFHEGNIPMVGGVSIFLGVCMSMFGEFSNDSILLSFMLTCFFDFTTWFCR